MDFTTTATKNGDFIVNETLSSINQPKERIMTKTRAAAPTPKNFILMTPLAPSYFGYDDEEVSRMVSELSDLGINTLMVDTGKELLLYARCTSKETLEALCSTYDIGGLLVEATAVYDQVVLTELA